MLAELSLRFPHCQRDVTIAVHVPAPAQRPHTAANLYYVLTGQLPPPDLLAALGLVNPPMAHATDEDAARAIKPLKDAAVTRVERGVVLETGGSTSHTIFGGFIADETVVSLPPSLRGMQAGTIYVSNMGYPSSNASRYLILLSTLKTPEEVQDYASFQPVARITRGLEEFVQAANGTPVEPRSLAPKRPVVLTACAVDPGMAALRPLQQPQQRRQPQQPQQQPVDSAPVSRAAGRVRQRDEDSDTEDATAELRATAGPEGGEAEDVPGSGFFQFSARFPTAGPAGAKSARAAKRRRAEAVELNAEGEWVLRTTAIAPGELNDDDDNDDESGDRGKTKKSFDYFNAQEAAFMNDIEEIEEVQTARYQRKMRRHQKQTRYVGGTNASAKALHAKAMRKITGRPSKPSSVSKVAGAGKKKELRRRY